MLPNLNLLASIGALIFINGCVSNRVLDRPASWPSPVQIGESGCKPISATFADGPGEQIPFPRYSYESQNLSDLLIDPIWDRETGGRPFTRGKAKVVQLSISTQDGAELKALSDGDLVAQVKTNSPTKVRCEAGRFVLEEKMTSANEGTTSRTQRIWNIYQSESGELIIQTRTAAYQSSMLVIHIFSKDDRWYRFPQSK
jgi:hypothetical protein